jgi:SIR2-like domain
MANQEDLRPPPQAVTWNDHNVYVIGAGFSKDAGLPVVDEFFNRTRDSVQWLKENHYMREADAVQRVLHFRLQAAAAALRVELDVENIEQLFSLVAAQAGADDHLMDDVTLAIAATLEFARRTARSRLVQIFVPPEATPPPTWQRQANQPTAYVAASGYEVIAGIMTGLWGGRSWDTRNTILSFNYDLTVEEALRALGTSFNYGFSSSSVHRNESGHDQGSELLLLKLHGSINWSICNDRVVNGQTVIDFDKVDLYRDFGALCQGRLEPLLIPPTWRKVAFGALSEVWGKAVEALATATRIVIVGYSMPVIDQHFKYLLAAGLQRNISLRNIIIVNPALRAGHRDCEALTARSFEVFKSDLQRRGTIEMLPHDASYEFFNAEFRAKLNRNLPKGFEMVRPSFIS